MALKNPTIFRSVRGWLFIILLVLTGLTAYRQYRPEPAYTLTVRKNPFGWGYEIQYQGRLFIDQPTIPGQTGSVGFASKAQARRVGEYVLRKLQTTHALPTLTPTELRQLGVATP